MEGNGTTNRVCPGQFYENISTEEILNKALMH